MTLNDLLSAAGVNLEQVIVLRHRPTESRFARVLPWLAADRHDLYDAYQRSQGPKLEAAMSRLPYVASFVAHGVGRALFVGLYRVRGSTAMTKAEWWAEPLHQELKILGMSGFTEDDPREVCQVFDMELLSFHAGWKGRLIVGWPPPERSWWRRAHRNEFPILAITEDSLLEREMPSWTDLVLSWDELAILPRRWQAALAQWRGIYHIRDLSDGKAYVGSAYGSENLLGRWQDYAATGHAGNRLLRGRDPNSFVFSILQRVSPDMSPDEVIALEGSWKTRLQTRAPHGLNEN